MNDRTQNLIKLLKHYNVSSTVLKSVSHGLGGITHQVAVKETGRPPARFRRYISFIEDLEEAADRLLSKKLT